MSSLVITVLFVKKLQRGDGAESDMPPSVTKLPKILVVIGLRYSAIGSILFLSPLHLYSI